MSVYGNGGPNGARVYWPAGLKELEPSDRAAALRRGWWFDGSWLITAAGERLYRPASAEAFASERKAARELPLESELGELGKRRCDA